MGSWNIAIILGIVEGLTEFLPVSSTGHLIIAGHLLGFVGEKAASFEVAIQLGAILSVVVLYWRRFIGLIPTGNQLLRDSRHSTLMGWSGLCRVALASFPALLVGYLARHAIKEKLFTPEAVTLALLVGGVAMLFVERLVSRHRASSLDQLTLATGVRYRFVSECWHFGRVHRGLPLRSLARCCWGWIAKAPRSFPLLLPCRSYLRRLGMN